MGNDSIAKHLCGNTTIHLNDRRDCYDGMNGWICNQRQRWTKSIPNGVAALLVHKSSQLGLPFRPQASTATTRKAYNPAV